MGAILNRISDEKARLVKQDVDIDVRYRAEKITIAKRLALLELAEKQITPDLEDLAVQLNVILGG